MKNLYSIIIPIYNEEHKISDLLSGLKSYYSNGHEIIIIDDGSIDHSYSILSKCNFIKLFRFEKNKGKGAAIKKGLDLCREDLIIIYDGDLELNPKEIKKLMILDKKINIDHVFATRYIKMNLFNSFWDFGNFLFSKLFNFFNSTELIDALCCAKSFHKSDLNIKKLYSQKFDIDVELSSILIKKSKNFQVVPITYKRRMKKDGKKLRLRDSFSILKRICIDSARK